MVFELEFAIFFGFLVGLADRFLIEYLRIELISEVDGYLVLNVLVFLYANYMLRPTLLEDFSDKLRVACGYEDEVKIWHLTQNQFFEGLLRDKVTFPNIVFEEQILQLG